ATGFFFREIEVIYIGKTSRPASCTKPEGSTRMKLSVCALFLSLLVSCLQTTVNVYVRSDGAGQVQETALLTHDAVELLRGLQALDSAEELAVIERAMRDDAAGRMGPGVRLVSAAPIDAGAAGGYEALFAFDRVDDLVLD